MHAIPHLLIVLQQLFYKLCMASDVMFVDCPMAVTLGQVLCM